MDIQIQAGMVRLRLDEFSPPVDSILDFASRENPKRGFLFVSKVLGKHVPCKPSQMRSVYDRVTSKIGAADRATMVIGMAETATGLGAGVADSLSRKLGSSDVYYTQTTRHRLDAGIQYTLDESHSHAVDHIVYEPMPWLKEGFDSCERLVLVDDEISTGRTLGLLAERTLEKYPNIKEVVVVSLVNWLNEELEMDFITRSSLPVRFVDLVKGSFEFMQDPGFTPRLPRNIACGLDLNSDRADTGRRGIKMPFDKDFIAPNDFDSPVSVVGTLEHTFVPFLIAEEMEKAGCDVVFQSTTRSPVLEGGAIKTKIEYFDEDNDDAYYIYNLDTSRTVYVICENEKTAAINGLTKKLGIGALVI